MTSRHVLVVGNGMVGQRFVDRLAAADADERSLTITVVGEEHRPAYDRVALSSWFNGKTEADLRLVDDEFIASGRVDYRFGARVVSIDTDSRIATLDDGGESPTTTWSWPPDRHPSSRRSLGTTSVGRSSTAPSTTSPRSRTGRRRARGRQRLVIGGGLLGLEAANALRALGLDVHVVEMAPYPMPQQLGEGGGRMLGRWVDSLGVHLHCGVAPDHFVADEHGDVTGLVMADGTEYPCDIVVFSAGVRPRDDLARVSGIDVGERGGVVVDDTLATSAPGVWAIGEVALHEGRVYGLVAPGYEMAAALADRLLGGDSTYEGSDLSTKLKLLGVDVACFGQGNAAGDGFDELVYNDPVNRDLPSARPRRVDRGARRWFARRRHHRVRDAHGDHARPGCLARRSPGVRPAVVGPSAGRCRTARRRDPLLLQRRQRRIDPVGRGGWLSDAQRTQGVDLRGDELRWLRTGARARC